MIIDATTLDQAAAHDLLKACVLPRPIAWVTTLGEGGVVNAAPYSCFTFLATEPALIGFSVERRRDGSPKDTLRNLQRTGELVVNLVTEALAEAMNRTAEDLPPTVSELERVGLATAPSLRVGVPRIAASPLSLECRLERLVELGRSRHCLVVAEVLLAHVADDCCVAGQIDGQRLGAIGRLAGDQYARTGDCFELDRPWLKESP